MATRRLRYTVCAYMPNPALSSEAFDFAVLVGGEQDAALVGVNLRSYGLEPRHSLARDAIYRTVRLIERRVDDACQKPDVATGFDLLDAVVNTGVSSFMFKPFDELESNVGTVQEGLELFAALIGGKLPAPPMPIGTDNPRWRGSARKRLNVIESHRELVAA